VAQECLVLNENNEGTTVYGRETFDCTSTTCPLDGSKTVWRIDLGEEFAVKGLTMQPRLQGMVHIDVLLNCIDSLHDTLNVYMKVY